MEKVKLCKDCKHCIHDPRFEDDPRNALRFSKCNKSRRDYDFVGWKDVGDGLRYCDEQRLYSWLESRLAGKCGKEGRYWEEK